MQRKEEVSFGWDRIVTNLKAKLFEVNLVVEKYKNMSEGNRSWINTQSSKTDILEQGLQGKIWSKNSLKKLSLTSGYSSTTNGSRETERIQVASYNMGMSEGEREGATPSYIQGVYNATPTGEQSKFITGGPIDFETANTLNDETYKENSKAFLKKHEKKKFCLLFCF